jgi:hypothetical protein
MVSTVLASEERGKVIVGVSECRKMSLNSWRAHFCKKLATASRL